MISNLKGFTLQIDGKDVGEVEEVEVEYEKEYEAKLNINTNKEYTLTDIETNIRVMSDKMRSICKLLKVDGKVYI